MADPLIGNLVKRLIDGLTKEKAPEGSEEGGQRDVVHKETEKVLIGLSSTKINNIARYILQSLKEFTAKFESSQPEETIARTYRIIDYLLSLLLQCFDFQWIHIRSEYRKLEGLDQDAQMILKQKEEAISPPPLEEKIAADYIRIVTKIIPLIILQKEQEPQKSLSHTIGSVLFQISSSNFEAIFSNGVFFGDLNDELQMQISCLTLESLSLNSSRLDEVLKRIAKVAPLIKKEGLRANFARSLRIAIWSWIDHFPMEFVSFCKSGERHSGDPDTLFELVDSWGGSSSLKKSLFWPLQMALLILSPDILVEAASHSDKKKPRKTVASKVKFLEALEKGIEVPKLADSVAICFVDVCKAATFTPKKESQSGVRHVVPRFENELSERLFNPQKGSDVTLNRDIMVDCLLAFYRLSHRKVIKSLFSDLLKPEYPPIFRLVLVECLLRIVQEGTPLPWNPPIRDVYQGYSACLRTLFRNLTQDVLKESSVSFASLADSSSAVNLRNLKKGQQVDQSASQMSTETLLKLILLFKEDPLLALTFTSSNLDDLQGFLGDLCRVATDLTNENLSDLACQTLICLHDPPNIRLWAFEGANLMENFWSVSSRLNGLLASALLQRRDIKSADVLFLISMVQEIFQRRNDFLACYGGDIRPDSKMEKIRSSKLKELEVALLVHLCSGKVKVISKCATCFHLLCREAQIVDLSLDQAPTNTILMNIGIYSLLQERIVSEYTSRKAQQKMLWVLLRRLQTPSFATSAAWEEVYIRWSTYTQSLLAEEDAKVEAGPASKKKAVDVKDMSDAIQEWSNCMGVLASLSGLCIDLERSLKVLSKGKFVHTSGSVNVVDAFVDQLIELVVSENVNIRESVKLVLGSALAPTAYSTLFRHFLVEIRKCFGAAGQVIFTDSSVLLVDQIISIGKLILESDTSIPEDFSQLTDFDDLLLGILKFVCQLDSSANSLLIKARLCGFIEAMMKQRSNINIRNEFHLRNNLIGTIIEWTTDFNKGKVVEEKSADSRAAWVQKGKALDLACLRAVASLVKGLPLAGEDDLQKSSTFSKFFSFFTQILTRCKREPDTAVPELASVTVECLSNMVSENIEHGLEYFVTMGYHEDLETRPAFLNVLTNILKQGAKLDSGEDAKDKYGKLAGMLLESNLGLVNALSASCQITEADEISHILVRFFDMNDQIMLLLRSAIKEEVQLTDSPATLFRRNSLATKLLVNYSKSIGKQYIKDAIGSLVRSMLASTDSFEIDPSKIEDDDATAKEQIAKVNVERVMDLSLQFLNVIEDSVPNCPRPIREICRYLVDSVNEKFPSSDQTAVCGFFFLRFFCPAIAAPEAFAVVQGTIPSNVRRALLLSTKCLQNLANRVYFGAKEPYMEPINRFIDTNIHRIGLLCKTLVSVGLSDVIPACLDVSPQEAEEDLLEIHRFLHRKFEQINKLLRNVVAPAGQRSLYDRFQSVMQQLGNPPEVSKEQKPKQIQPFAQPKTSKDDLYSAFMKKFEGKVQRTDEEIIKKRNIFYESGRTKEGHPVFYYIVSRYDNRTDGESFLFHALKLLQPFFESPWHLVVDCTLAGATNEFSPSLLSTLDKVVPLPLKDTLQKFYVVNANSWAKKHCKRVVSRFASHSLLKRVVFTTVRGLGDFIPPKDINLPSITLSAEDDVKSTFPSVLQVSENLRKREVTILLGNSHLQVLTTKPYHLLGQDTPLLDFIPIGHIYECELTDDSDFQIKYTLNGQRSLHLRTPNAKQIVQQLKAARERLRSSNVHVRQESFKPSDVRGALLNISLLNLGSDSISVREAAYNLLAIISNNFNFNIRNRFLEANGMYLPRHSANFVSRVSEELSKSHKELTLEFLLESLRALRKEVDEGTRTMCLNYILPWIPNLASFCKPPERLKTADILKALIAFTVENPIIAPAILSKAWALIGDMVELHDFVIEGLLGGDRRDDKGDAETMTLQDIAMALSTRHPKLVLGKLIAKLCVILNETDLMPAKSLSAHDKWPLICLAIRLILPLSFDNVECVQQYLPDIFYIILLVFGMGSSDFRHIVHQLFVNTVHSLYTSMMIAKEKDEKGKGEEEEEEEVSGWTLRLPQLLNEIDQLSFRLYFGVSGSREISRADSAAIQNKEVASKLKLSSFVHVELVAMTMVEVIACASPNQTPYGTALHSRLLSHIVKTSFTLNAALQSRSIVSLGVLCCAPYLITEELFSGVLVVLKRSLQRFSSDEEFDEVPVAILMCLSRMYGHLPTESNYFQPLFWVAMTLLQINNPNFFQPALNLVDVILKTLQDRGCFDALGVSGYLLSVRSLLEPELTQLDQVTGISFNSNFSFAISAHLLKGFRYPMSKSSTMRVLSTFIDLTAKKTVGSELLGYLAALLPIQGEGMNLQQILLPGTADDFNQYSLLFTQQMIPDMTHAALLFSFLTAMLNTSDSEYEQLFIYECIKEGVKMVPEAFAVVYDTLLARLGSALQNSQNKQILKVVLKIMESTFTWDPPQKSEVYNELYLHRIGFQGLSEMGYCGDRKKADLEKRKESITRMSGRLLDRLFELYIPQDRPDLNRSRSQPLPKVGV